MKNGDDIKKEIAVNTQTGLGIFMLVSLGTMAFVSFSDGEMELGIAFMCFALLTVGVFLFLPLYTVFTAQAVQIVYLNGYKENIPWKAVKKVEKWGSWSNRFGGLPCYRLQYATNEKLPFFAIGEIPRSRRAKKLLDKYWKKGIRSY